MEVPRQKMNIKFNWELFILVPASVLEKKKDFVDISVGNGSPKFLFTDRVKIRVNPYP